MRPYFKHKLYDNQPSNNAHPRNLEHRLLDFGMGGKPQKEEKTMTREEAIRILASSCIPGSKQTEAIETLIPELAESEDERIRKELVEKISNLACGCFISQEQKQRFIHYLEKQKEQPTDIDKNQEKLKCPYCCSKNVEWMGDVAWSEDNKPYCCHNCDSWFGEEDDRPMEKEQKPSEDELGKKHLEGYIMGREDTMREMKDFIESHFNCENAKKDTPIVYNTQSGTSTLKAEG